MSVFNCSLIKSYLLSSSILFPVSSRNSTANLGVPGYLRDYKKVHPNPGRIVEKNLPGNLWCIYRLHQVLYIISPELSTFCAWSGEFNMATINVVKKGSKVYNSGKHNQIELKNLV